MLVEGGIPQKGLKNFIQMHLQSEQIYLKRDAPTQDITSFFTPLPLFPFLSGLKHKIQIKKRVTAAAAGAGAGLHVRCIKTRSSTIYSTNAAAIWQCARG